MGDSVMTIREQASGLLLHVLQDPCPYTQLDDVLVVEDFGKKCIERFRGDLLDFLRTQPDGMFTRANILAIVQNLKPEVGA